LGAAPRKERDELVGSKMVKKEKRGGRWGGGIRIDKKVLNKLNWSKQKSEGSASKSGDQRGHRGTAPTVKSKLPREKGGVQGGLP